MCLWSDWADTLAGIMTLTNTAYTSTAAPLREKCEESQSMYGGGAGKYRSVEQSLEVLSFDINTIQYRLSSYLT